MKNTIFKFISCLLCAALMVSGIVPVSFAAYDDGIYVQFDAPKNGKAADYYPYIENYDRYDVYDYNEEHFVGGVRVRDLTLGLYMDQNTALTHEHDYQYEVIIAAKEGYGFSEYQGNPNVNTYFLMDEVTGLVRYATDVQWFGEGKDKILMSYTINVRKSEEVDFVSLQVTQPVQGEYLSYDCTILSDYIGANLNHDDGKTCINGLTWYDADNTWDATWLGEPLSKDCVFVGGKTYRLTIRIAAEQAENLDIEREFGFSFAPLALNDRLLVNGYASRGEEDKPTPDAPYFADGYYIIYKDFYCPVKNTIKEVALEVDPPMLGHHPDFDAVFCGAGYKAIQNPPEDGFFHGVKWRDMTAGKNLTAEDVFEADHRYVFSTYLEPADENSTLAVDAYGSTTVTGTMNGNSADIYSGYLIYGTDPMGNDSHAISYEYNFGVVSNELTRVAVMDVEEPVAGETPDFAATVKNEALYTLDTAKDDGQYIVNGVCWKNDTTGESLTQTDTFTAGEQYSVYVYLSIDEKYTLGNTMTSSINGKDSLAYAVEGNNHLVLIYTFPEVEPKKTTFNQVSGLHSPKEGEKPYTDLALLNTESIIKNIRWHDVSVSENGPYLTETDAFIGGHVYRMELDLVPQENYAFMTDEEGNLAFEFLFEVDGGICKGEIEGTENEITAMYTFSPIAIGTVDVELDAPVPGVAPAFVSYTNNDACYVGNIIWYDKTAEKYITEDDAFEENHVYVVSADVFAIEGRFFDAYSESFVGTINGEKADIGVVSYQEEGAATIYDLYYAMRFSYTFAPCVMENLLTIEYDPYVSSVSVGYEIYSSFEEDALMVYIAFYDSDERLVSCVLKPVEWASDKYLEYMPENAAACKAMLWHQKTLEPLCKAASYDF